MLVDNLCVDRRTGSGYPAGDDLIRPGCKILSFVFCRLPHILNRGDSVDQIQRVAIFRDTGRFMQTDFQAAGTFIGADASNITGKNLFCHTICLNGFSSEQEFPDSLNLFRHLWIRFSSRSG